MNVAIFSSAFYPHTGGVEELVRQLAHAYRAKGHQVIILTNRWPRSLPVYEEYEGIPVYRLAFRVPEGSLKAHINYRLTHSPICREMEKILRERKIDILHVQCVSSNGYYALLAQRALGLPLIVTAQGELTMDPGRTYQRSMFMNRVLRTLLAEADFVTACSRATLADLEAYAGKSLGYKASVVYNGVRSLDFDRQEKSAHSRPFILGIGRLVPQKGFDVLLRAFAQAGLSSHDLLIAGEGPERETLEQLARNLGLRENVRFLGRADRPTAVSLFKGCDLFVLPSRLEPFGIVNLEAMAAGKAVIATRVGGVAEVVLDGETGVVVPGEDVDALAAAISQLISDSVSMQRFGAAGKERAKLFAWARIADAYLDIYSTTLPTAVSAKVA